MAKKDQHPSFDTNEEPKAQTKKKPYRRSGKGGVVPPLLKGADYYQQEKAKELTQLLASNANAKQRKK